MRQSMSTQETDIFARFERQHEQKRSTPPPPRTRFEAADIEDAHRTLRWLDGKDMSKEKKWIVKEKNIPCTWFAIQVLAPENGISSIAKAAKFGKYDKRWHAYVSAAKGHGKLQRIHGGASSFGYFSDDNKDKRIALAFAARNAIRQLLPMQPNTTEKMAWRGDEKEARKHI